MSAFSLYHSLFELHVQPILIVAAAGSAQLMQFLLSAMFFLYFAHLQFLKKGALC